MNDGTRSDRLGVLASMLAEGMADLREHLEPGVLAETAHELRPVYERLMRLDVDDLSNERSVLRASKRVLTARKKVRQAMQNLEIASTVLSEAQTRSNER